MNRMLLTAACAVLLGCMPELDEAWQVKDLRLLGIRAEPPEILVPQGTSATLPSVTVDALVVDPASPADQLHDWELWVCTPDSELCDEAEMSTLLHRGRTRLDAIRHSFVPAEPLCRRALELSPGWLQYAGRVPLALELRLLEEGVTFARGTKSLYLGAPDTPGTEPNSNPSIDRIEVNGALLAGPLGLEGCGAVDLAVWTSDGEDSPYPELFVSQGSFSTTGSFGDPADPSALTASWSPCGAGSARDGAALWIVLRDGRGGIDWAEVQAILAP
jgi:hypothetical protein